MASTAVQIEGIQLNISVKDNATKSLNKIANGLERLNKATKASSLKQLNSSALSASGGFSKLAKNMTSFASSVARIAKYRMIRSILKSITDGLSEGVNNLYQYSKAANGEFAQSMDTASSAIATFKNGVGVAVAPLISSLVPALTAVVSWATSAANSLARFFAIMGGKSTYTKAIAYTKDFADSAKAAGGAAKQALKDATASIDELNVISDSSSSGGGGSSGGSSGTDFSKMFEETGVGEIPEFLSDLKITFDDVFCKWDNLTEEQIAEKVFVGIMGLFGFIGGLLITGSFAGGILFTVLGIALALAIASVTFDHDGKLSNEETAKLINMALWGTGGGALGLVVTGGNPAGATFGFMIGVSIGFLINQITFDDDGALEGSEILKNLSLASPVVTTTLNVPLKIAFLIDEITKEFGGEGKLSSTFDDLIKWVIFGDEVAKGNITGRTNVLAYEVGAEIDKFKNGLNTSLEELSNNIRFKWDTIRGDAISKWSTIKINLSAEWQQIKNNATTAFEELKNGVIAIWEALKEGIKAPINAILGFIDTLVNGVINGINGMIDALNSIDLDIDDDVPIVGGLKLDINIPKLDNVPIPRLAEGGFPSTGQLFIANEAGAEMVGSIDGRTAVANNQDIVSAVASGVYSAVTSAMSNSNGNGVQSINVFLDGKQIEASVRNTKQRRGASIANGGIYNFA